MDLDYPTYNEPTEDLKATAREVLETLECLLYLMDKQAASPQQVKTYVVEAKKALWALQVRVEHEETPRPHWLM
jgi:hypothetical protein